MEIQCKSSWKSLKKQLSKLINRKSRNIQIKPIEKIDMKAKVTKPINSNTSTPTTSPPLLSLESAAISSMHSYSNDTCNYGIYNYGIYNYDIAASVYTPRNYKLCGTNKMANKTLPRYYFTQNEHIIMKHAWKIITNINETDLFNEYKAILFNDNELKSALINNGVNMREQFDIIFDMFNKIITQKEYQQYNNAELKNMDIITVTSTVLKMIGLRQANVNKIIPSDYTSFGSCFLLIFEKYLEEYYRTYPQCRLLLNKCWKFIFDSITVAFDVSD